MIKGIDMVTMIADGSYETTRTINSISGLPSGKDMEIEWTTPSPFGILDKDGIDICMYYTAYYIDYNMNNSEDRRVTIPSGVKKIKIVGITGGTSGSGIINKSLILLSEEEEKNYKEKWVQGSTVNGVFKSSLNMPVVREQSDTPRYYVMNKTRFPINRYAYLPVTDGEDGRNGEIMYKEIELDPEFITIIDLSYTGESKYKYIQSWNDREGYTTNTGYDIVLKSVRNNVDKYITDPILHGITMTVQTYEKNSKGQINNQKRVSYLQIQKDWEKSEGLDEQVPSIIESIKTTDAIRGRGVGGKGAKFIGPEPKNYTEITAGTAGNVRVYFFW